MKWLMIDNLTPNQPVLINLANVDAISWLKGTLTIEYMGGTLTEYECEEAVFISIASMLDIVKEIE